MRHVCYIVCKSSGLLAFLTFNIEGEVSGVGLQPSIHIGCGESRAIAIFSRPSVNMILTRLHLVLFLVATLLLCLVRLTDQSGMRLGKTFCEIMSRHIISRSGGFRMSRYHINEA